jgi:hypothetical protein
MRLRRSTSGSRPPTISSVGARTRRSASPARSGRPPRDTTALTRSGRSAAAISAAAAGARSEAADRELAERSEPVDRADHAAREQLDVEPKPSGDQVLGLLLGRQEIHQQRAEATVDERVGNGSVARAETAAAAAVGENHKAARSRREGEEP